VHADVLQDPPGDLADGRVGVAGVVEQAGAQLGEQGLAQQVARGACS
jgi:hypothetical protein